MFQLLWEILQKQKLLKAQEKKLKKCRQKKKKERDLLAFCLEHEEIEVKIPDQPNFFHQQFKETPVTSSLCGF